MKIRIYPLDYDPAIPADQSARISAFEASHSVLLPRDYRVFLERYDGGHAYPNVFHSALPLTVRPSTDDLAICDAFYRFDEAVALWRGDAHYDGTPKGFFFIAQDPGGMEILMSLRPQDHGTVYVWYHSSTPWGEEGNDEGAVFRQATSFTAFLQSLFETEDKVGFGSWNTPKGLAMARDLVLD